MFEVEACLMLRNMDEGQVELPDKCSRSAAELIKMKLSKLLVYIITIFVKLDAMVVKYINIT